MKLTAALLFLLNLGCGAAALPVANTGLDAAWSMMQAQCKGFPPNNRCDNMLTVYNTATLAYNAAVVHERLNDGESELWLKQSDEALKMLVTELTR